MQISAELRWFHAGTTPPAIRDWFMAPHGKSEPGKPEERLDIYLGDGTQAELGVKSRGRKPGVEVKGLIGVAPAPLDAGPFAGPIQLWSKWTSTMLALPGPGIATYKCRWLRKFDTGSGSAVEVATDMRADSGCNVELTRVVLADGESWWSFGFEAFDDLLSVERSLRLTAAVLAEHDPPAPAGELMSYPEWLRRFATG